MELITLWPDALLSPSFAPVEPVNGLRSVRVRLGRWWSPAGFPWDVAVALLRWEANPVGAVVARAPGGPASGLAVPCLVLTPLPWAHPTEKVLADLEAWLHSNKDEPSRFGAVRSARWQAESESPTCVSVLRQKTLAARKQISTYLDANIATGAVDHKRLRTVGAEAPWQFLMSAPLRGQLVKVLGLGGPLRQGDILTAAHQWQGQPATTAGNAPTFPPEPTKAHMIRGLVDLVARGTGPRKIEADELANYLSNVKIKEKTAPSFARFSARRRAWKRKLRELDVGTVLVPLPRVPHEPGLAQVDPAPGGWALEWLQAGRAPHLMRLAFGRQIDRFAWCSGTEGVVAGLGPFVEPDWKRSVVAEPADAGDCARIEWSRAQEPDSRRGAASPFPGDLGEYFRLVVAPAEHDAHEAERCLAVFTAAVTTDPDARSVAVRLASAHASALEGKGGVAWATVLNTCAVLAAARVSALESRGAASAEEGECVPPSPPAGPATEPPSRRQTGRDLINFREKTGLFVEVVARLLRCSKEDVLRAEGAADDPLPNRLHVALLKAKARDHAIRVELHPNLKVPATDWEAPLQRSARAADTDTGASLRKWRGRRRSQATAAKLLGVSQSEISRAASALLRMIPPLLARSSPP